MMTRIVLLTAVFLLLSGSLAANDTRTEEEIGVQRFLYVAEPGIRNYLDYGGHGVLVYDIDDGHRFLRRIPMGGLK